jgi:hypothetical protein
VHPGADDFWDGNWLIAALDVVAGGFHGKCGASLRAEELLGFREVLERVDASLEGEAALESMESWLTLRVAVDRSGHLAVIDQLGSANELTFGVEDLDQSGPPPMIEALREIETFFPVI